MEKDAATLMFQSSTDHYHMNYTLYAGEGESSSFKVVRETVERWYLLCWKKVIFVGRIEK